MNPQVLIHAIDRTQSALEFLAKQRDSVCEDLQSLQNLSQEYSDRAESETRIQLENTRSNLLELEKFLAVVKKVHEDATFLHQQLLSSAKNIQQNLAKANSELQLWQNELSAAHNWHNRAVEKLRQAEREVAIAEAEVRNWQQQVEQAGADLAWARRQTESVPVGVDKEGRTIYEQRPIDTTPYERALYRAESNLSEAKVRLSVAERELNRVSKIERAAADQVAGCQAAVRDCNIALAAAEEAFSEINKSLSYVDRAISELTIALKTANEAYRLVQQQVELCEQAKFISGECVVLVENKARLAVNSMSLQEDCRNLTYTAVQIMQKKIDLLVAFDSPMNPL